jgi:hypothetical protein
VVPACVRAIVTLATIVCFAGAALAQDADVHARGDAPTKLRVSGRVIDAAGKPVRGATVAVQGGTLSTRTDRDGRYTLDGVDRDATLVVDAAGYTTALATATGASLDDVVLVTERAATEVIDVRGTAPAVSPGAAKLDREDVERVPGTGGDLVRTLTIMPGIVNTQLPTGFGGGIVIRGSSPQDSKVLIDDFEVPLLYHAILFRAILPVESIESLEYVPGGFDVAYGRASSGIIALTTRRGADKRTEQAEISLIDGGLVAQGTANDWRYTIAFRRSTIDLVLPYLIPSSVDLSLTTVPRYYDEQLRIDHALGKHWNLTLSSIGSDDLLSLYGDKAQNPDKHFFDHTQFVRTTVGARYHDGPWTATVATSLIVQQYEFDIGAIQHLRLVPTTETTRAEVTRTARELGGLYDVVLRAGTEAEIGHGDLDIALPNPPRDGQPMRMFDPKDTTVTFKGSVWEPDFAQWVAATAGLGPRIRATFGLRADEYVHNNDVEVQPRGEITAKVSKLVKVRLAAGMYTRPPENMDENLHPELRAEKSSQMIVGVEVQPDEALRVQSSLYYTDRTHLITTDPMGVLANNGRGTTYGAELLGTYRRAPWFVWLSMSLSRSTRVDFPGAPERLFDYDQPVSINAAASWKHGKWQLGARFELYSGLPSTPVAGSVFDSDRNLYVPIFGAINSVRAPAHHQLDLRVDRNWKWGPVQMTGFLDVQNVYMNQSVAGYSYSYDYSQQIAFKSLPIIPSIGLRGVL